MRGSPFVHGGGLAWNVGCSDLDPALGERSQAAGLATAPGKDAPKDMVALKLDIRQHRRPLGRPFGTMSRSRIM